MRSKFFIWIMFFCLCFNQSSVQADETDGFQKYSKALTKFLDSFDGIDHARLESNKNKTVTEDEGSVTRQCDVQIANSDFAKKVENKKPPVVNSKFSEKTVAKTEIKRVKLKPGLENTKYDPIIEEASTKRDLDPHLLKALISVESDFNPKAVSSKGAQGLTQLMPENLQRLRIKKPFDPHENINGGAEVLSENIDRFGDIRLALAAYNAGPERVKETKGIPKFPETQKFVRDVIQTYESYKNQG